MKLISKIELYKRMRYDTLYKHTHKDKQRQPQTHTHTFTHTHTNITKFESNLHWTKFGFNMLFVLLSRHKIKTFHFFLYFVKSLFIL